MADTLKMFLRIVLTGGFRGFGLSLRDKWRLAAPLAELRRDWIVERIPLGETTGNEILDACIDAIYLESANWPDDSDAVKALIAAQNRIRALGAGKESERA